MTTDFSEPGILLARELQNYELWRRCDSGQLERIRRGAYAPSLVDRDELERALTRARLHIEAVAHQTRQAHWFSHQSAALLHGLPTLGVPSVTHVIQQHRPSGRNDPRVRRHLMTLAERDRDLVDGLPVTSLQRTVLDCARTRNAMEAVMILDAYLNRGGDQEALRTRLAALRGHRGVRLAASHLDWADSGAESPGESRTRVVLIRAGLRPQTQVPVRTHLGRFWLDMGWPEYRVGLEYDGRVKYTTLADGDPAGVVIREKRRQDALEDCGWSIQRVTSRDLDEPARLVAAVRDRLRRVRR